MLQETLLSHIFCFFSFLVHQCGSKQLSLNQFTSHPPKTEFHKKLLKTIPWLCRPALHPGAGSGAPAPRYLTPGKDAPEAPGQLSQPCSLNPLGHKKKKEKRHFGAAGTPARAARRAPRRPRPLRPAPRSRAAPAAASPRSLPPSRWQPPPRLEKWLQARLYNTGRSFPLLGRMHAGPRALQLRWEGGNATLLHNRTRKQCTAWSSPLTSPSLLAGYVLLIKHKTGLVRTGERSFFVKNSTFPFKPLH